MLYIYRLNLFNEQTPKGRKGAFYNLRRQLLKYQADSPFQLIFIATDSLTSDPLNYFPHIIVKSIVVR